MPDEFEPVRQLGLALTKTIMLGASLAGLGQGRARRERRRAQHQARVAEREAEKQHQKWRELVERQNVRGKAGNATYDEAAEALHSAGGRPNPLDQRKF
jgi:uncharacterized protein HemX